MISPDRFYAGDATPSEETKKRIWRNVKKELISPKWPRFLLAERRSFLLGMAASLLLYFSAVGIVSTIRDSFRKSQPSAVRLDEAYMNAIREFEQVIPHPVSAGEYVSTRQDQLAKLNAAIATLWQDAARGDLSPLKQLRLRQLYGMKLQTLQSMIENGGVTL